jgi:hypothetical protein
MMYSEKFAVAIKVGGKVLRERGDTVHIPFGTEYTIMLKNLNTVRALVTVTIDNTDVGNGVSFVVPPNDTVHLERFVKDFNTGNRFKFIERTAGIEQHRGIDISDGLIRVEYQFERVSIPLSWNNTKVDTWPKYRDTGTPTFRPYGDLMGNSNTYGDAGSNTVRGRESYDTHLTSTFSSNATSSNVKGLSANASDTPQYINMAAVTNDVGITVPGSISNQLFHTTASFLTESASYAIVIRLLGVTEQKTPVKTAVTVKSKPRCVTCKHQNKSSAKFCTECGTSLLIV